ncbi:hypothetical protein EN837_04270 [bacterium M00.F.Ca.ET.194.01.1.1]|nr:hypothetical protein EN837_04270 [bacterium M00.F.Ca.ET.194.01.1.1]TGS57464.1 hypothetical protein EN822_04270 [bacterium M00.F.Ca.ET.179.01.1.1]TGV50396.1 hypothetical protein EN811_04270 [bacterium M00.F.Ca.ET.168.01.1.1]
MQPHVVSSNLVIILSTVLATEEPPVIVYFQGNDPAAGRAHACLCGRHQATHRAAIKLRVVEDIRPQGFLLPAYPSSATPGPSMSRRQLPHGLFQGIMNRQYPLHILHLPTRRRTKWKVHPYVLEPLRTVEASGIPIPAGAYFGKEKIQTTGDHTASRAFLYSLELTEKGKNLDVTPLVEVGKITVVRQSAL